MSSHHNTSAIAMQVAAEKNVLSQCSLAQSLQEYMLRVQQESGILTQQAMTMGMCITSQGQTTLVLSDSLHAAVEARESVCSFCTSVMRVARPVVSHNLR